MKRQAKKSKIDEYVIAQVKVLRESCHKTQVDIAVHLNMSNGFIGQIESPKCRAKYSIRHLNELAKLFKCSPADFLPKKPL